ncbi:MAG: hypothetical protein JO190_10295 [Candidatus Eremiobacteraeota bacterium]|nr:hypothetical protein [Candidatus Eremiobacteraeota bacterium]
MRKECVALAAAAVVAGCGGGAPSSSAFVPLARVAPPPAVQSDQRDSWISPDIASSPQLLFESDLGTGDVDVYSLPDMTLKATLTGFAQPTGECSDTHGNVWIANTYKDEMFEYSHAGKRIATIKHAGPNPQACAVNPRTGEIAVMEFSAAGYTGPGEVYVYSKPDAAPKVLRNPDLFYYEFALYDSAGRLWIDGIDAFGTSMLSKCGRLRCSTLILHGGSIFSIGTLAWDAATSKLTVFDSYCHDGPNLCSYPVSEGGAIGKPTLYLSYADGEMCTIYQVALTTIGKRSYVVGGDSEYLCTGYKNSTVDLWPYPAGGRARRHRGGVVFPYGAAVSR